ncbi:RagB/SusD family nutrient uptake outer membrane protein [Pedobacter sp. PLR]|uniref:RagB/SusD family nutrient uptake outer membrane protein n=1 Tax=Pedobacter sp. PLR TaxID=2994465 RepID=UPI00224637E9|nr:RagB/SusD family nutrient uptake outer membrane protein [Pedobacter sp. PLR]MCX2453641.1 RagB/SusD family nutrient uptake outer membrane protein [Pedobacter sp. PLR]
MKDVKKYIPVLCLLFFCLISLSCKKFLEEQSQTEVIPKTVESLNELLLGEGYQGVDKAVGCIPVFYDDDKEHHGFFFGTKASYYVYTWQPDQEQSLYGIDWNSSPWVNYYKLIQICNVALDYSGKVSGEQAAKDNLNGQAYLLRAFYYFKLVNLYGKPYTDKLSAPDLDPGVPLIIKSGVSLEGKKRNTVKEVYQQILDDLGKGIPLLEKYRKDNGIYRINYLSGYLLSSRVNLYMGNWKKVIEAATEVINNKSTLVDLNGWGTPDQNNKPVIRSDNPETIWAFGKQDDVTFDGGNSERDNYQLSASLLSLYEDGDLRRSVYIKAARSIKRVQYQVGFNRTAQSLRVSEAFLNRAEAYAQLNKEGGAADAQLALNDLNTLRKKRFSTAQYKDLLSVDADDLLQKCYDEKRREFFEEEQHRWFDLRRHGMPSISHSYYESEGQKLKYVLQDHDPAYLMQIPKEGLILNKNLVDNPKPAIRVGQ